MTATAGRAAGEGVGALGDSGDADWNPTSGRPAATTGTLGFSLAGDLLGRERRLRCAPSNPRLHGHDHNRMSRLFSKLSNERILYR